MSGEDSDKQGAIRDLQAKFSEATSKLKQVEGQRRAAEVTLRRAAFTAAQLDEMPEDAPTYAAVGRAYFLQPKPAVMARLEGAVHAADGELKALAASKEALLKVQQGARTELGELLGATRRA